jgi:hypothetical protein
MDAFQSVWYRLGLLFGAVYLTVFWFVLGPSNPVVAVLVVGLTFGLGPVVGGPVMRRVPPQWFIVPRSERVQRPRNLLRHPRIVAGLALFTGHPWGAVWILLPGVPIHLYPVLLQRSIMLRLQPLLDTQARISN